MKESTLERLKARAEEIAEKQTCIQILHDLSGLIDYETQYKPLLEYIMNH